MITIHLDPCIYRLGPIGVYWYGICIALAVGLYLWLVKRDAFIQRHFADRFDRAVLIACLSGVVGARLVHIMTDYQNYTHYGQYFLLTKGGLSMWGGVIGVLVAAAILLKRVSLRRSILDRFALYAPWLHAMARVGCLLAGCCHGVACDGVLGMLIYTHSNSLAEILGCPVVPTQIFSSVLYIVLGMCMLWGRKQLVRIPGLTLCVYIIGVASERWLIDWWRSDRVMEIPVLEYQSIVFSFHQYISMALCAVALVIAGYLILTHRRSGDRER